MDMGKIQETWHKRRVTILYIILIVLGLAFLAFIRNRLGLVVQLDSDFSSQSENWWQKWATRATILNLFVDIVGFALVIVGGWFAASEFQKARRAAVRAPDLRIMEKKEGASILFERDKQITLVLVNDGKGVAQHFLVQVEVPARILKPSYYDRQPSSIIPSLHDALFVSGGAKYWNHDYSSEKGIISLRYYNRGDFPCFDEDQIPLAEFELSYDPLPTSLRNQTLSIKYSIQSERMKRKSGQIQVTVPEDAWED